MAALAVPPVPRRLSRRRLLQLAAGAVAVPVVSGTYATQVEPFWPRYHQIDIPVQKLPASFAGFRVAHLTDLHIGRVPIDYLCDAINRVRLLKADLAVVTGDLIHHNPAMIGPAVDLMSALDMPVVVTFGNHEYGVWRGEDQPFDPDLADKLENALKAAGHTVLRNGTHAIVRGTDAISVAGMDDLWYGGFNETAAFKAVPAGAVVLALSHNPDTIVRIAPYGPALTLCGHTHGGQIRIPGYGALRLNIADRQYDRGLFFVGTGSAYVSTGVGYIRRVRFCCRPEVPVFRLVAP